MKRVRRFLGESFLPLVTVFVAASIMLVWAQYETLEEASRETVIQVRARSEANTDTSEDDRITAPVWVSTAPNLDAGSISDTTAQYRARAQSTRLGVGAWADLVALYLTIDDGDSARAVADDLAQAGINLPDALRDVKPAAEAGALAFNLGIAFWRGRDYDTAVRYLQVAEGLDSRWQTGVAAALLRVRAGDTSGEHALQALLTQVPADDRPRVWFALGSARAKSGDDPGARTAYERALELDPALSVARLNLAVLDARDGMVESAEARYQRLIRDQPDYFLAHYNYGILLERLERDEEALEAYRSALVYEPQHADTRHQLADLLLATGQPAEARKHYEWLQQRSPSDPSNAFGIGRCDWRLKEYEEAEHWYREAINKSGGNYPEAWVNLGLVYRATGDLAAAEDAYRSALQLDSHYAGALRRLGDLYGERDDWDAAAESYRAATVAAPRSASLWRDLGRALDELDEPEGAEAAYETALGLDPDDPRTWSRLGILRAQTDDPAGAVKAYERAIELDPESATTWFNLGLAHRRMDADAEAIRAFKQAIELASQDDAEGVALKAHRTLGHVYRQQHEYSKAFPHYHAAIQIRADDTTSRYYKAWCLYQQSDYQRAQEETDKLLKLDPKNLRGWKLAQRIAERRGDEVSELAAAQRIKELE